MDFNAWGIQTSSSAAHSTHFVLKIFHLQYSGGISYYPRFMIRPTDSPLNPTPLEPAATANHGASLVIDVPKGAESGGRIRFWHTTHVVRVEAHARRRSSGHRSDRGETADQQDPDDIGRCLSAGFADP